MTEWDYLRAFHARHPEAGAFESTWLERFNRAIKKAKMAGRGSQRWDNHLGDARREAAKQIEKDYVSMKPTKLLIAALFTLCVVNPVIAQQINAETQLYNKVRPANGGYGTAPGTSIPATCSLGQVFVKTDSNAIYICTATDTWTPAVGGNGTVTGVSFTGGLISVADPTTTPALTVAGTSGGVPYFSSASTWATSAALTANLPVIGGGAGAAPAVGTRSGNTTAFVTTTGAQTSGDCVEIDANGNHVASGAACGGGGGGGSITYCADATGSTTAYTCPSATGYSLAAGARATFVPQATNSTTTPTVAIAGGAAKTIKNSDGTAITAGQIIAGKPYDIEYNGTNQLVIGEHLAAGPTGALVVDRSVNPPTVDIVTAVVPRLAATNTWTGAQDASGASQTAPVRIGASDPATCDDSIRELFFNSTSNLLKSCNTANTWTAITGSGSFDPTDPTAVFINEEWLTANTSNAASTGLGTGNWIWSYSNTVPTITFVAPVTNHYGIMQMVTSNTATENSTIQSTANGAVIGLNTLTNWTLVSIFKTDANNTNLTALWTGFSNGFISTVAIVYEPASSANWLLRTCSASVCTDTSTGVAYANSSWFTFTIDSAVSGTIGGTVNSGSRVTNTTNIPSVALPIIAIAANTNGTSHTFLQDKIALKITGVTR